MRTAHPRIDGLLLASREEPQHKRAWERGAGGEEHVAASLEKYLDPTVLVLHDRRIPGSQANIDHIAVATFGVWVMDAKRYEGKRAGQPTAVRTAQAHDRRVRQVKADRSPRWPGQGRPGALAGITPGVPILGALCFVDAELPLIGKLTFRGYPVRYPGASRGRSTDSEKYSQHYWRNSARS